MSKEETTSKDKVKKPKKKLYVVLGIIVVIIMAIVISSGTPDYTKNGYPLTDASGERVVVLNIDLQIIKISLDGSGKITETNCEDLKAIVRKFNPNADWFEYCTGSFAVNNGGTDLIKTIQLSDDERCALLTFDKDMTKLTSYEFNEDYCKGYRTIIVEDTEIE